MLDTKTVDLTKPVTNGVHNNIRIIATDRKDSTYPVIALVETEVGIETIQFYTKDGRYFEGQVSTRDLVNKKETYSGTVFVVIVQNGNIYIYSSGTTREWLKATHSPNIKAIMEVPWQCAEGDGL